jgi:hypothetical protein
MIGSRTRLRTPSFGVRANAADRVGHFLAKSLESRARERRVAVGHGAT